MLIATGFPRSCTAWASNWFTTCLSFCQHDPAPGDAGKVLERIKGMVPARVPGICGSEIAEDWGWLREQYPRARWAVLHRNDKDAMRSFLYAAERRGDALPRWAVEKLWERRKLQLYEVSKHCKPFEIDVKDLKDIRRAREFWQHCLPEVEFDEPRYKMLIGFNIDAAR